MPNVAPLIIADSSHLVGHPSSFILLFLRSSLFNHCETGACEQKRMRRDPSDGFEEYFPSAIDPCIIESTHLRGLVPVAGDKQRVPMAMAPIPSICRSLFLILDWLSSSNSSHSPLMTWWPPISPDQAMKRSRSRPLLLSISFVCVEAARFEICQPLASLGPPCSRLPLPCHQPPPLSLRFDERLHLTHG